MLTYIRGAVASVFVVAASAASAIETSGWSCSGTVGTQCGKSTADGVVTNAPVAGTTGYAWVSTSGASPFDHANLPTGVDGSGVTNGVTYTSVPFSAEAGAPMAFHFNYVSSDGTTAFSDMAWARLLDVAGNQVALLFTARTTGGADTVPGYGMPAPAATITPAAVPMILGGPAWTPLGGNSGDCYDSSGCGYTGWVRADYTIASAGTYRLEVGVVNWGDSGFDSGLAVDGLVVGGQPVGGGGGGGLTPVPTLGTFSLASLGLALAALGWRRRKS